MLLMHPLLLHTAVLLGQLPCDHRSHNPQNAKMKIKISKLRQPEICNHRAYQCLEDLLACWKCSLPYRSANSHGTCTSLHSNHQNALLSLEHESATSYAFLLSKHHWRRLAGLTKEYFSRLVQLVFNRILVSCMEKSVSTCA